MTTTERSLDLVKPDRSSRGQTGEVPRRIQAKPADPAADDGPETRRANGPARRRGPVAADRMPAQSMGRVVTS